MSSQALLSQSPSLSSLSSLFFSVVTFRPFFLVITRIIWRQGNQAQRRWIWGAANSFCCEYFHCQMGQILGCSQLILMWMLSPSDRPNFGAQPTHFAMNTFTLRWAEVWGAANSFYCENFHPQMGQIMRWQVKLSNTNKFPIGVLHRRIFFF